MNGLAHNWIAEFKVQFLDHPRDARFARAADRFVREAMEFCPDLHYEDMFRLVDFVEREKSKCLVEAGGE